MGVEVSVTECRLQGKCRVRVVCVGGQLICWKRNSGAGVVPGPMLKESRATAN